MRPPAPFFDTPPGQQRARSIFSSVALSFLAPLFFVLVLFADCLDWDEPFERRAGVASIGKGLRSSFITNNGDSGERIPDLTTIDALSSVSSAPPAAPAGVAVPLTLHVELRSHRSTWGILRHALRPLVPAMLRSTALEEEGDGLVALRTRGRAYDDDSDAGRASDRGSMSTTERQGTYIHDCVRGGLGLVGFTHTIYRAQ